MRALGCSTPTNDHDRGPRPALARAARPLFDVAVWLPHSLLMVLTKGSVVETGRYLVLGTMHVAVKTAEMLDAWALLAPGERPLAVASTHYGWFIPTRNPEQPDRSEIPPELLDAMRLGREQGCDYLLFDCDAGAIDGLAVFPW